MEGLAILSAIPALEDKKRAWDIISRKYSELILDSDEHPVEWVDGVLRFKEDPSVADGVDLTLLAVDVARGLATEEYQRKVAKSCGYSLAGYFSLSYVQKWSREVLGCEEVSEQ